MNQKNILKNLNSLPPAAKQQVLDYIEFLLARYGSQTETEKTSSSSLSSESFIGMWRDRTELADSSRWVRETRDKEWRKRV
jgi:hypothetical protein